MRAARLLLVWQLMSSPRRSWLTWFPLLSVLSLGLMQGGLVGCGSAKEGFDSPAETFEADITPTPTDDLGDTGDDSLVAVDDSAVPDGTPTALAGNTQMTTTGNLNLRKGPGTTFAVIAVIPVGSVVKILDPKAQNNFVNVEWNGTAGWSSLTYLKPATSTTSPPPVGSVDIMGPPSPDNAWARALPVVGFSYYWGAGRYLPSGPTASTKGSCNGSCPSCTHTGMYGADCSGLVSKAWQYGAIPLDVQSHEYSTLAFNTDKAGKWSTIARPALKRGDALVYNTNGSGHIVLYEKGDGWGTPSVIECRGCAAGCVYNARTFSSTFHAIRRSGF